MWNDVSILPLALSKHRSTYTCHTCASSNFKSIGGDAKGRASVDTMCLERYCAWGCTLGQPRRTRSTTPKSLPASRRSAGYITAIRLQLHRAADARCPCCLRFPLDAGPFSASPERQLPYACRFAVRPILGALASSVAMTPFSPMAERCIPCPSPDGEGQTAAMMLEWNRRRGVSRKSLRPIFGSPLPPTI